MTSPARGGRLARLLRTRWVAWVSRRIPPAREVVLTQRNIFIIPTGSGFAFLALLLALLITGINYESNLVFALTFLLGGLFIVGVLHTYANLAQLRLSAGAAHPVFAGEQASFSVQLRDEGKRAHDGITLAWLDGDATAARVAPLGEDHVLLFARAGRRGWLRPGRLRLESRYPLGLLRAWSWLDLDMRCLVYPRPAPTGPLPLDAGHGEEGSATHDPGAEDFSGFRNYNPGDPLRHVAWKTLAKGQPLQTREYVAFADRRVWLTWAQTADWGGTEQRLALLCRWVLELYALNADFGLDIPGTRLEPGAGEAQRDRALAALALFGIAGGQAGA
jgi:uncharacterized protein (DUF58 family)